MERARWAGVPSVTMMGTKVLANSSREVPTLSKGASSGSAVGRSAPRNRTGAREGNTCGGAWHRHGDRNGKGGNLPAAAIGGRLGERHGEIGAGRWFQRQEAASGANGRISDSSQRPATEFAIRNSQFAINYEALAFGASLAVESLAVSFFGFDSLVSDELDAAFDSSVLARAAVLLPLP